MGCGKDVIKKATETQLNAIQVIMEAQRMKDAVANEIGEKAEKVGENVMIPYAAFEMQADRHDAEKDKIRKGYRRIITGICVSFTLAIALIIGTIFYVASNYEFASYSQDGNGINNYLSESAKQGDLTYEPENPNNTAQVSKAKGNSNKQA